MSWIRTITYADATGRLRKLYDRIKGPNNNVDNIMLAQSLRPHSMEGHMAIYKNVLHHNRNRLPKWFLELIGVYVSLLNKCDYCVEHHAQGLKRLIGAEEANSMIAALTNNNIESMELAKRYRSALSYAAKLTRTPNEIVEADINALKKQNLDDGEILEINQVTAYFAYANRTVLGLGVTTEGDVIGLSPGNSDDPNDWGHI